MNFVVRTSGEPTAIVPALRDALATVDGALPMFRVMSMERVYANRYWGETLTMKLLAWCAVGALLLAVVGIYGVISYSVTQRRREMGIRIALGAGHREVISLVVRQGLYLVAGGIGFGLFLGFGLSRGLSFMLFGVNPNDPTTYLAVVAFVACAAIAASYIPARRATRVDPIVALREE
jgi:putative ABC transport system permease protein